MKKSLLIVALCALSVLGLASSAMAQDTVQLTASLTGANEVGDAGGDPDGTGSATITIDAATNQVCFEVSVAGIDPVMAGHIHTGGAGTNGGVVVDLGLNATTSSGCVTSDVATVASILNAPSLFYVNVHTEAFPDGAIRGQLAAVAPAAAPTAAPTAEPVDDAATTAEPTDDATTTEAPATTGETLAFTGDMTGYLAIAGSVLLVSGAAFVVAARRRI